MCNKANGKHQRAGGGGANRCLPEKTWADADGDDNDNEHDLDTLQQDSLKRGYPCNPI